MQTFIVISHDSDQQQTFFDFVRANSADEAARESQEVRPYADILVGTYTIEELNGLASLAIRQTDMDWKRDRESLLGIVPE